MSKAPVKQSKAAAAHSATMECYRRAMLKDQTFEGRHES